MINNVKKGIKITRVVAFTIDVLAKWNTPVAKDKVPSSINDQDFINPKKGNSFYGLILEEKHNN